MKSKIIYGLSYYGWDDKEDGREYFFSKKERDERMRVISAKDTEPFQITINKKSIYKLNFHGIAKDKREIENLKEEVAELKKKLRAKIELLIHES